MKHARIDLAIAYLMTALFGVAIMIIAAGVSPAKVEGYEMILSIAERLEEATGSTGKWMFLIGFWGAVFSSLIGVWNGVPYLFADFMDRYRKETTDTEIPMNAIHELQGISTLFDICPTSAGGFWQTGLDWYRLCCDRRFFYAFPRCAPAVYEQSKGVGRSLQEQPTEQPSVNRRIVVLCRALDYETVIEIPSTCGLVLKVIDLGVLGFGGCVKTFDLQNL